MCYTLSTGGETMKFNLIIDKSKEEEITATVHYMYNYINGEILFGS